MPRRSQSEEVPPPPLQMIGDLMYSPGTDIPFGKQIRMIIRHLLPQELSPFDQGLWRSFFIVGWTCVYLDNEPAVDMDEDIDVDL